MSGFDSAFHEQPVNMIGMGIGPVSLPGMNMPYGYLGRDARPCGGIGGYDAAANEGRRLQDAAWNSVTTNNIHEPYKLLDTSASLPDTDILITAIAKRQREQDEAVRLKNIIYTNPLDMITAIVQERQEASRQRIAQAMFGSETQVSVKDVAAAQILRQRDPLTVYEQTGYSHISHVRDEGFHITTQVPRIGKKVGLDGGLSLHTYVTLGRNGHLEFDSEY